MTLQSTLIFATLLAVLATGPLRDAFVAASRTWRFHCRELASLVVALIAQRSFDQRTSGRIARLKGESFQRMIFATSPAMRWLIGAGFAIFGYMAIQHPLANDLILLLGMAMVILIEYVLLLLFQHAVASIDLKSFPAGGLVIDNLRKPEGFPTPVLLPPFRPPQLSIT